jgi:DNA-entry nuclease
MRFKGKKLTLPGVILLIILLAVSWYVQKMQQPAYSESVKNVPAFSGEPYVVINNNQPEFTDEDITTQSYEYYAPLDALGRCSYTMACIGLELMPTEDRESISQVRPTGWVQAQYDFVDGKSLYNRCHLIGFQLTGENANERNLITGTRYMNVEGMLPFENMVADYIRHSGNHVIYRVTPVHDGNNLVARGVQMEAWSVEDQGEGVCFNVYVYNNQPGVIIDYATGESHAENVETAMEEKSAYILNTNSKKFHKTTCTNAHEIKEENKQQYTGNRQTLLDQGYLPSGCCNP